jgi:hypothetical protein
VLLVSGVVAWWPLATPTPGQDTPGPDLAPLFLGGRALWHGLDPTAKQVHWEMWQRYGSGMRPGQFFMPYPTTGAFLAMPLSYRSWADLLVPVWAASAGALALAGLGAGGCATRRGLRSGATVAAAGLGLLTLASLDVNRHALELGQANPLVVLITVAAGLLLARGRDLPAGTLVALGVALKFFPGLLLIPILAFRRWRALAAAVVTGLVLAALTVRVCPDWSPLGDLARAWEQATIGQATEHPPLGGLWRFRGLGGGLVTVAACGWLGWRRQDEEARTAAVTLALALGALEAGGMSPPHEVLLVAPALVLLVAPLARGWTLLTGATAAATAALVLSPLDHYPQANRFSQDHALVLILILFSMATAWTLWLGGARPTDPQEPSSHPNSTAR